MDFANIILAAPAASVESAEKTGLTVAYMIYKIGRGYHLYRAQGTDRVKGGLMVVDTDGYSGGGPMSELVSEILGECARSDFSGVVLDTGGSSSPPLFSLTGRLAQEAASRGKAVYIPEGLAQAGPDAIVLLPTALSGGTLSGHITDALERYGHERVALEVERVRMDFTVPAVTGAGKELSAQELSNLIEQYHPQSFLSKDLCANYFTYREKKGTHFVLYDNSASIRRKLSVAAKLGVKDAFLFYPHVQDIIDKIMI